MKNKEFVSLFHQRFYIKTKTPMIFNKMNNFILRFCHKVRQSVELNGLSSGYSKDTTY